MDDESYFNYLRRRSFKGAIYRRWWLYPRLCRYFTGKVLDIGCGLGDFLAHRPSTVGVDVNSKTVAWCQQRGLEAQLIANDTLPFADASYDGALLDNVLEHIRDPAPLLKETMRVLKPGGRLVAGVPGLCGFAYDVDHKVSYTEADLLRVMQQAGFTKDKIFYMPLHIKWLDQRLRQYCLYGVFHKEGHRP